MIECGGCSWPEIADTLGSGQEAQRLPNADVRDVAAVLQLLVNPKSRASRPLRKIPICNFRESAKDLIGISLLPDSSLYSRMNANRSVFTCFL